MDQPVWKGIFSGLILYERLSEFPVIYASSLKKDTLLTRAPPFHSVLQAAFAIFGFVFRGFDYAQI